MRQGLLCALLLYVTLDLSLPDLPGAFAFDPDASVESVDVARARPPAKIPVLPVPSSDDRLFLTNLRHRLPPSRSISASATPVVKWLPRAHCALPHSSEDPH
jgi:hypothetical protein